MADDKRQDPTKRPAATAQDKPGPHPSSQHIADEPVTDADAPGATVQKPTTETGLPVEEQVRKEWDTNRDGGLPTPLAISGRDEVR